MNNSKIILENLAQAEAMKAIGAALIDRLILENKEATDKLFREWREDIINTWERDHNGEVPSGAHIEHCTGVNHDMPPKLLIERLLSGEKFEDLLRQD